MFGSVQNFFFHSFNILMYALNPSMRKRKIEKKTLKKIRKKDLEKRSFKK